MNRKESSDTDQQNDWTFKSKDIAKGFTKHVNQHLPWYPLATNLVKCIVENYIPADGILYDIGASRGNITRELSSLIESRNISACSFEVSKEMVAEFEGVGDIFEMDAVDIDGCFDVSVCFLTLMFNSIEKRARILDNLLSQVREGGCIVIVEKFEIESGGYPSTVQRRMTMRQKLESGVSHEDIVDKELSLSGVQRPMRLSELDKFSLSEFFRVGEFRGFILTN